MHSQTNIIYEIERIGFISLNSILAVYFFYSIAKSLIQKKKKFKDIFYISNVPNSCKLLGLMSSLFFIAGFVDFHTVFHIYSLPVVNLIGDFAIGLILLNYVVFAIVSYDLKRKISFSEMSDSLRTFLWITPVIYCVAIIAGNVVGIVLELVYIKESSHFVDITG